MGREVGVESSRDGVENCMHWDGDFRYHLRGYRAVEFRRGVLLGEDVAFVGSRSLDGESGLVRRECAEVAVAVRVLYRASAGDVERVLVVYDYGRGLESS